MKNLFLILLFSYSNFAYSQLLKTVSPNAGNVTSVGFFTNKPEITIGTSDGVIIIYDHQTNVQKKKVKSKYDDIEKIIIDPDNKYLYVMHLGKGTGSSNNTFNTWDMDNYKESVLFQMSNYINGFDFYKDHNSAVFNTVTVHHSYNYVHHHVTVTTTSRVSVFNGETKKFTEYLVEKKSYKSENKGITSKDKDFDEFYWMDLKNIDNNRLIFYGVSSDFVIYDLSKQKVTDYLTSENVLEQTEFDISPNKTKLVNASYTNNHWLYLWDINTAKSISTLKGHKARVKSVNFSPDGNYIASADKDGKVVLWETKTGKLLNKFNAHEDDINQIRFSPDGRLLITCSNDGTAKIWDAVKIIADLNVFATQYDFTEGIGTKLTEEMNVQIEEINKNFQRKGEFETTESYNFRVKEKEDKINSIRQFYDSKIIEMQKTKESEFVNLKQQQDEKTRSVIEQSLKDTTLSISNISSYNADYQTFSITIKGITKNVFISLEKAPLFKENWKKAKVKCKMQLFDDLKNYKYFDFVIIDPVSNEEIIFEDVAEKK